MIKKMMADAQAGKPVYITTVHERFGSLAAGEADRLVCVAKSLDGEGGHSWNLTFPRLDACITEEQDFVREYIQAEIYNILSSIGAREMDLYVDFSRRAVVDLAMGLNETFCIGQSRKDRRTYGRAINVLDRMIEAVCPSSPGFSFRVEPLERLPKVSAPSRPRRDTLGMFRQCTSGLVGRSYCGIDVGGTDIKAVLVADGLIVDYKEYDWFPAQFTRSSQLIDPICLLARLLALRLSIHQSSADAVRKKDWLASIARAMDKDAPESVMEAVAQELEAAGLKSAERLDGIGLCFPDVVVRNKIVGGEVYKTRGIRNNPDIDYEADFAGLTHLDERLRVWVKPKGGVHIINDGPMASFTAAVEIAASDDAAEVANGVFAHTLGTELGTGWVTENGDIPDIPLEVYNFIIDLGSRPERQYEPDDLRSVNNFNTGLPGTLQKYCSQSGVFRLALKYFPSERPDLFQELKDKGFVVERTAGSTPGWYVPTEPVDQRKAFLEHMMKLPDRERDETNRKIWREIGEALAVTLLESKRILDPGSDERFLFGRLVKQATCFDLMVEGGRRIKPDLSLVVAGTNLANTPLMKQLEAHPHYTVAQFAQAIGAVYFANRTPTL